MPRVTVRNVGALGVIPDLDQPPHEMPPEAWSRVQNINFIDGSARRALGESAVEGAPSVVPTYLFPAASFTSSLWVYTNLLKVFAVVGGVHTNITRQTAAVDVDYTGALDNRWNGGWLGGVMILNNGVDDPQNWNPIATGTKLIVLPNWPASTTARTIRVYRNFLVALDVTKAGTRFPTMIKWSHPAEPGTIPVSWDETDATKLAGEKSQSETPGFLVDAAPIGASLMVYKEDAVIRMDRIPTNDVFGFKHLSTRAGLMGIDCAKEFLPGKQIAFTLDADVMVTDGQQMSSVTDRQVRAHLESLVDGANRGRSFVVVDPLSRQVFVCFPEQGKTYCTKAAIWNWEDNTWSFKQISDTVDIKSGIYDESAPSETWNSDSEVWDADVTTWNERLYKALAYKMLGAFVTDNQLWEHNVSQKLGTTAYTSVLERTGLALVGQGRDGQPKVDPTSVKQVTEIWPLMSATQSMTLSVSVGAQDTPTGPITWDGPYNFDPTVDQKVDVFIEGNYIAVKFESAAETPWKFYGYGLQLDVVGEGF